MHKNIKTVLLINSDRIPHYRIAAYNYMCRYLAEYQFDLKIVAEGIQKGNPHEVLFQFYQTPIGYRKLLSLFKKTKPDAVIFWVRHEPSLYPLFLMTKLKKIKLLHWGHRRYLARPNDRIRNIAYVVEHCLDDAIIVYADHLKKYIWKRFHKKTFSANNTLNLQVYKRDRTPKDLVKKKYGIMTEKNIICIGRIQRRKRIDDLLQAFSMLKMKNTGLILVGPDDEGILDMVKPEGNIYKIGPVYGEESLDLLAASEVFCLPGSIGLSIVDAFFCGLPTVTENGWHGPEIMYLKDGVNGFIVPQGDIVKLAEKLDILLKDNALRQRFSQAARTEIATTGHIDRMCEGFMNALEYVFR